MSAAEYKAICNRPSAFNRSVLEETARTLSLTHPALASKLREVFASRHIPKPMLHDGDGSTDYFLVELSADVAEKIADAFGDAEAGAIGFDGETTPEASRYATLRDVWAVYAEFRAKAEI